MTGSVGHKRVPKSYVLDAVVPLAPFAEQIRIADRLERLIARVDDVGERLDRVPKLIKKFRQAVLSAAVSGELTREWRGGSDHEWKQLEVAQVALAAFDGPFGSNLKTDDYVNEGIRVVRLENIGHLQFYEDKQTFITTDKYRSLERHTLQHDDVIVSSFIDEQVRACLYDAKYGTAINKADCFVVRVDPAVCLPQILLYALASITNHEALAGQVHGATRPRINLKHLKGFAFQVPPLDEQAEIIARVTRLLNQAERLHRRSRAAKDQLSRLTPALLAKAFRGELVMQDPDDEPAAELLKRVVAGRLEQPRTPRQGGRPQGRARQLTRDGDRAAKDVSRSSPISK